MPFSLFLSQLTWYSSIASIDFVVFDHGPQLARVRGLDSLQEIYIDRQNQYLQKLHR